MGKRFFLIVMIGFILSLTSSIFLSMKFNSPDGRQKEEERLLYIPSGKYLKPVVLGFDQLVADLLWIKTLTYFGTHALGDHQYPFLTHLLDAVTTLDPFWEFPYHFAGIVMSIEGDMVDESNKIVRKGMDYHPDIWQLPFYIGFNYFHVKENARCGAKFILKASTYPGSPSYLKPLAARLSAKGNDWENHRQMCNRLLLLTKDKQLLDQIKKKLSSETEKG